MKRILLFLCGLWLCSGLYAQDVGGFFQEIRDRAKNNPVIINGGLSTSLTYARITGIDRRQDPFSWNLNGNLGMDILGIKAPLSVNIADKNVTYNLPAYRFVGISPSYKWIKLHFGDRSMNFSPFTFSGQLFTGAGMELKPGKFRFSAMYGRLRKANASDVTANQDIDPIFKRMAWGMKMGYGTSTDFIDLTLFSALDKIHSIDTVFWKGATPARNVVVGLNGRKKITKQLSLFAEYAGSAYTPDRSLARLGNDDRTIWNSGFGLLKPNASSYFANAYNGGVELRLDKAQFTLGYKRVEPNYRSLGTFYLYNDYEHYTFATAFPLWRGKIGLSLSGGLERNNLSNTQASENLRVIGSVSINAMVNQSGSLTLSYSNFYNTNKVRQFINPNTVVDSLFIAQVNQNASVAYNTVLNAERKNALTAMFSYQNTNDIQGEEIKTNERSHFYNTNISYIHPIPGAGMQITTSANANRIVGAQLKSWTIGPAVTVSKSFLDQKMTTSITLSDNAVINQDFGNSNILNLMGNLQFQFLKGHHVGFRYSLINRASSSSQPFTEQVGMVQYGYGF